MQTLVVSTTENGRGFSSRVFTAPEIKSDSAQYTAREIAKLNADAITQMGTLKAAWATGCDGGRLFGGISVLYAAVEGAAPPEPTPITEEQFYKDALAKVNDVLDKLGKPKVKKLEPSGQPNDAHYSRACSCPISTTLAKQVPGTRFATSGTSCDMYTKDGQTPLAHFPGSEQREFVAWADRRIAEKDAILAAIEA